MDPRRRTGNILRVAATIAVVVLVVSACASDSAGKKDDSAGDDGAADASVDLNVDSDLPQDLQDQLDEALVGVMERFDVPGASVASRTPDGFWTAEAGVADLDTGEPVSADLAWPLRSITKSFTVTAIMQLAEEGVLSLDDTIDEYVDAVPNGDTITLRQLAAMTSGVGDYSRSEAFGEVFVSDPDRVFTLEELNAYGLAEEPQFEPGTDAAYSNTSTNLLGVVVEDVTGMPLGDVIAKRYLQPLGLDDTTYPTTPDDWPGPHAVGYQPDDDGNLEPVFNNFTGLGASGAMVGTRADMEMWARALGSGELLSSESQTERLDARPLSDGPEYDTYGLGIGELDGWWGHTGEGLGYTALVMFDPDTESTVVITMNISAVSETSDGGEVVERHAPTVLMREFAAILDSD